MDENHACDFESWEDPIVAPPLVLSPALLITPLSHARQGGAETAQLVPL